MKVFKWRKISDSGDNWEVKAVVRECGLKDQNVTL